MGDVRAIAGRVVGVEFTPARAPWGVTVAVLPDAAWAAARYTDAERLQVTANARATYAGGPVGVADLITRLAAARCVVRCEVPAYRGPGSYVPFDAIAFRDDPGADD